MPLKHSEIENNQCVITINKSAVNMVSSDGQDLADTVTLIMLCELFHDQLLLL